MNGWGIVKGLSVTIGHFFDTYYQDLIKGKARYHTAEGINSRCQAETSGAFTIQYPEEKLPLPEEFRYLPILIYDENEQGELSYRCTACGICAKVCPPQCIWIVRGIDPETLKPIPSPMEYCVDIDICMSCGLCAEFCPFDAIKMDHDYEIADQNRIVAHKYDKDKLGRSIRYYAEIKPRAYDAETQARREMAVRTG